MLEAASASLANAGSLVAVDTAERLLALPAG